MMPILGDGNYQGRKPRNRFAEICIAGEPVVEVDISASLLTFMHAMQALPLPEGDLYDLPGLPRGVVKEWVNAALGKDSPVLKWSPDTLRRKPEFHDHPA